MNPVVRIDMRSMTRGLDDVARKQAPYAMARALTDSAQAARVAVSRDLPRVFEKPTPFTRNAVTIKAARKTDLTARVFVKTKQAEYLAIQETGGTRTPRKRALVLPAAIQRDQYGNIPRGGVRRVSNRKDTFSGVVGGVGGIWQRRPVPKGSGEKAGRPRLLVAFKQVAKYRPRFGFQRKVVRTAQAVMVPAFRQRLAEAMRTRRG
ncbi:hypothetical protein [Roseomonas indoligenes]|uniref:Uncharacterized protein n=1 Tax=Roseomonas indoligenes TaxID=2820811 RepID=A0A940MVW2_9PROT|nr:hypothetical protein [Pararoseomonas indoligenes]MBP0492182.1 hypothetical protein [Pararoseomonas indoligenes]